MDAGVPTASLYAGGGEGDGMGAGVAGCRDVTGAGADDCSNCTPSKRLTSSSSPSTVVRQCTRLVPVSGRPHLLRLYARRRLSQDTRYGEPGGTWGRGATGRTYGAKGRAPRPPSRQVYGTTPLSACRTSDARPQPRPMGEGGGEGDAGAPAPARRVASVRGQGADVCHPRGAL